MNTGSSLGAHVDDTIESVAELERKALADASLHQRTIERITRSVGRPRVVFVALGLIGGWIALNLVLAALRVKQPDPPPFYWLETVCSAAAVIMTVMILTTQNRSGEIGEQRARLHLQISIVAERKAAKVIGLLEELRRDLPSVPNRPDHEAAELTSPANPHEVAVELEKRTAVGPEGGDTPGPNPGQVARMD